MSWSEWQPLEQPSSHAGPAVYEFRIGAAGNAIPVPRFLATDDRGVLSIGETKNTESRRCDLLRAIAKCNGHSEGNLLYYLIRHSPLTSVHPMHTFQYRFRKEQTKGDAEPAETRLIKAYIRQFGEGPPLNCAIPDRHGDWECQP
jgi:hypothetical protein